MAKSIHFLKSVITFTQDLTAGAVSHVTTETRKWKLEEVTIHFNASITETVTITRDSNIGANYDTVLATRDLVGETDFVFRPQGECNFLDGDNLRVQCTNSNTTGSAFGEIKTSEM